MSDDCLTCRYRVNFKEVDIDHQSNIYSCKLVSIRGSIEGWSCLR